MHTKMNFSKVFAAITLPIMYPKVSLTWKPYFKSGYLQVGEIYTKKLRGKPKFAENTPASMVKKIKVTVQKVYDFILRNWKWFLDET